MGKRVNLPPVDELYQEYLKYGQYKKLARKYHVASSTISKRIRKYKTILREQESKGARLTTDDHCSNCAYGNRVSRPGQKIPTIVCMFQRCIKHHGWTADKRRG